MEHGTFFSSVESGYLYQNVFIRGLGVFDKDVEVAVIVEYSRIYKLVLEVVLAAIPVPLYKL